MDQNPLVEPPSTVYTQCARARGRVHIRWLDHQAVADFHRKHNPSYQNDV